MKNAFRSVHCAFRIVHCALLLVPPACGPRSDPPVQSPPARALQPVSLPDMTGAAEPVQAQLRARYASLTLKIESAATPNGELAGAYGEMGKLLIAAEYLDAAESCFA